MPAPDPRGWAEKALTSADFVGKGYLSPAQIDHYLNLWRDTPTLIGDIGLEDTNAPVSEVSFLNFGSRIFHRATAAEALDPSKRAKPTPSTVEFVVKKLKAHVELDDDTLEDQIARKRLLPYIMGEMQHQGALDLEWYCLMGDTAAGDDDLQIFDGFLKQVPAGQTIAHSTPVDIGKEVLREGLARLKSKYKANRNEMRIYCSHTFWEGYTDSLGYRQTALGDMSIIAEPGKVRYKGIPLWPVVNMPDDTLLIGPKKNFVVKVLRRMKQATQRDEAAEITKIILTVRLCPRFLDAQGVVKITGVGTGVDAS